MKKMILLLILPLTALMAIDFTMTQEGLFTKTTTQSPTPATSSDLEPVNLPTCDAGNPEVQLIRSNADWSTINSNSKRIFCVSPGDYTSLANIKLTVSGTAEKRRYIILNNGNDVHPGKLETSELAQFALQFNGADYWTVDRGALVNSSITYQYELRAGSTHNILNRCYSDEVNINVLLKNTADNNTIQKCRFENMKDSARRSDFPSISFKDWGLDSWTIKNTKIIANEIVNTNDAVQTVLREPGNDAPQIASVEGTIIDSNDMYITSDVYTDGKGNYDPSGSRAYAENAIDLKVGSRNASNPMIITNNHMWGYRKSDGTNSNLSDPGYTFVAHFGVSNIKLNDNVIFDSNRGIGSGDSRDARWSMYDSEVKRNIIKDNTTINDSEAYPLALIGNDTTIVEYNVIINARNNYMKLVSGGPGIRATNNIGVNSPIDIYLSGNNGGTYSANSNKATGYTKDYTITTDKFTNSPRVITLKNVLKPD